MDVAGAGVFMADTPSSDGEMSEGSGGVMEGGAADVPLGRPVADPACGSLCMALMVFGWVVARR